MFSTNPYYYTLSGGRLSHFLAYSTVIGDHSRKLAGAVLKIME